MLTLAKSRLLVAELLVVGNDKSLYMSVTRISNELIASVYCFPGKTYYN